MVWVPGVDEVPMSVLAIHGKKEAGVVIKTCGHEPMMKKIYDLAMETRCHIQVSLERVFKCGVGICAACVIGPYLVCHDGPVFSEAELSGMPEFGHMRRDLSGKRVPLNAGH